eukprot:1603148-Prymnesium_polylepis.1
MWRPACRIIHTGVRSTCSPRAARSSSGSAVFESMSVASVATGIDAVRRTSLLRRPVAACRRAEASAADVRSAACVLATPSARQAASIFGRRDEVIELWAVRREGGAGLHLQSDVALDTCR